MTARSQQRDEGVAGTVTIEIPMRLRRISTGEKPSGTASNPMATIILHDGGKVEGRELRTSGGSGFGCLRGGTADWGGRNDSQVLALQFCEVCHGV